MRFEGSPGLPRGFPWIALWYTLLAVGLTWPAAIHPETAVPGGLRTDVADSWWTFWYVARALSHGQLPGSVDGLLNFPLGGSFFPADPVDAALGTPLVLALGAPAAWSLVCILHLALAGVFTHAIARRIGATGWVAGTLYVAAPMSLSHLQNGASEAVVGTALLPFAGWAIVALAQAPGPRRTVVCAGALALAVVGHAYTGVSSFLFLGSVFIAGATAAGRRSLAVAGLAGALLAAPVAYISIKSATAADNVIGIKNEKELTTIRRKIGPVDPEVYVHPGDFRSPDFRRLSRYGEEFVHSSYLGFVPMLLAIAGLRRTPRQPALWIALVVGLLLAMGPVLVADGSPVILAGRRAIPLPYLLVEKLPGFSSLSLVWRLAQLGSLALSLLAAGAVRDRRVAAAVVALGLAETRFVSPARHLPDHVDSTLSPVFSDLRDAPEGAVMNFPVVGSRGYLYEQTVHQKPVTGTLNFPNNNTSRRIWKLAVEHATDPALQFHAAIAEIAQKEGVRYLVLHTDARSFDDTMHTGAVRAIKAAFEPAWEDGGIRIYRFY